MTGVSGTKLRKLSDVEDWIGASVHHAMTTLTVIADAVSARGPGMLETVRDSARDLRAGSRRADAALVRMTAAAVGASRDPRVPLALMQVALHLGLIANQFELIGEQLAAIDPDLPDPQRTGDTLARMAKLAGVQLMDALSAFTARDVAAAERLEREDDTVDQLNREVFRATYDLDGTTAQRELAYRQVLIARSLERIADNAVDIAEQTAFIQTAEPRQFTDASTPHKRLTSDS